jgi:hypothetical protein
MDQLNIVVMKTVFDFLPFRPSIRQLTNLKQNQLEDIIRRQKPEENSQSEFILILEFIGYRNLSILGLLGSFYFVSGFKNYIDGMRFYRAFSPYYALHFNNGISLLKKLGKSISMWMKSQQNSLSNLIDSYMMQISSYFETNLKPMFDAHPVIGLTFILAIGFALTIIMLATALLIIKKAIKLLALGSVVALPGARSQQSTEEVWSFDPHKRASQDQLKITQKNLEKLVQRAPVLGGHVPKNADSSLKEMARRNMDSDYNYRNAIYVMGPIKGTNFDNQYDIPIAIDQIKRISSSMKQASDYETLPLDLVILRAKKGSNNWETEPSIAPVSLGKSFPVKCIERIMVQYRNTFIWDQRATKAKTGHGAR